jgi:hypothetical protein
MLGEEQAAETEMRGQHDQGPNICSHEYLRPEQGRRGRGMVIWRLSRLAYGFLRDWKSRTHFSSESPMHLSFLHCR